jgi:phosphopantothenoylcysteine decarboxylase/phosphopantothenate--cysteine ligase
VAAALAILSQSINGDLNGERFLITVGATREEIDPVRFISNRSSGKMGFALADAAYHRGAQVVAIAGTTSVEPPRGIRVIRVNSAQEMSSAVLQEIDKATVFVGAAAVADYKPSNRTDQKIKKHSASLTLELERTPDILAQVSSNRNEGTLVIGFAAETENVLSHAESKLRSKHLDAIVANDITRPDSGFDSNNNAVTILTPANLVSPLELPLMSKADTANRILDVIVRLRSEKTRAKTSSN